MARANGKESLNLSIDCRLKHRVKVQCAVEDIDISFLAESLFTSWLGKREPGEKVISLDQHKRSPKKSSG